MLLEIVLRYMMFGFCGVGVVFLVWFLCGLLVHDKSHRHPVERDAVPEPARRKRQSGPYAKYVA